MKLKVFSWTVTVCNLRNGIVDLDQLADAEFYFSCAKEHVLTEGLVPYEATWRNKQLPTVHHIKNVDIAHVDPNHQQLVLDLLALISKADKEGRVYWKIGSQPSYIQNLHPETPVLYEHGLRTAKDYK